MPRSTAAGLAVGTAVKNVEMHVVKKFWARACGTLGQGPLTEVNEAQGTSRIQHPSPRTARASGNKQTRNKVGFQHAAANAAQTRG